MTETTSKHLFKTDPVIANLIQGELQRQREHLELIASENFVSPAILTAQGSVLTNKYAEGLPGRRYYSGCEFIDQIEEIAIDRAKLLFSADHANVQPHSGSQANFAVFLALLEPGDTIMSMNLRHKGHLASSKLGDTIMSMDLCYGGHITHGSSTNVSGKWFKVGYYGVSPETEQIDYNQIRDLALQYRPKLLICGYSNYPRIIQFDKFREIADEVGAYLLADISHIAGLITTGHHPNPVPYCDVVTTTTHKTLRGPRGGLILTRDLELGKKLDRAVFPGSQGGPLEHIIAAKAVAFSEALQPEFKTYCSQVLKNAHTLATRLQQRGFRVVSGGTDNHMVILDLSSIGITGQAANQLLSSINVTANKTTIPFDPEPPSITSGLRLGSPAMTTRGMRVAEFTAIADIVADRLLYPEDAFITRSCHQKIAELCACFPLYHDIAVREPALI